MISRVSGCSASVGRSLVLAGRSFTTLDSNVVLSGPSFYPLQEPESPLKRILNLVSPYLDFSASVYLFSSLFSFSISVTLCLCGSNFSSLPRGLIQQDRRRNACIERLDTRRLRDGNHLVG